MCNKYSLNNDVAVYILCKLKHWNFFKNNFCYVCVCMYEPVNDVVSVLV